MNPTIYKIACRMPCGAHLVDDLSGVKRRSHVRECEDCQILIQREEELHIEECETWEWPDDKKLDSPQRGQAKWINSQR